MTIEEIEELALEEYDLQEKIQQTKKENRRKKRKHKLQEISALLKLLPFLLPTPISMAIYEKVFGRELLKAKPEVLSALITEEYDEDGTKTVKKVYSKNSKDLQKSEMSYYTLWSEDKDGTYKRKVYIFDLTLKKENKDIVTKILDSREITSTDELRKTLKEHGISKKPTVRTEYTLNPTEMRSGYIEATISTLDKTDTIEIPRSLLKHILEQLGIFVLSFASNYIILALSLAIDKETEEEKLNAYINKQCEIIDTDLKLEDIESMKKRLLEIRGILNNPETILDNPMEMPDLELQEQKAEVITEQEPQKILKMKEGAE